MFDIIIAGPVNVRRLEPADFTEEFGSWFGRLGVGSVWAVDVRPDVIRVLFGDEGDMKLPISDDLPRAVRDIVESADWAALDQRALVYAGRNDAR